ncbi:T9SS C-terminal target domain-containing protein [Bacteroides sp. 214]|uniref:pectate lyase family protein n=1 Tax=Bacteroides sp. 214 TaxID=2302935 RepID=UPI0013D42E24|nr:T9SS type A sorting domain-containing protein [Bacteroides sp. 214]NDW13175.1 T9SS C-terminal target domain-containing protein [Bacteroides sp. 214]
MKNKLLLFVFAFFSMTQMWAQVTITEASGWLESAYAKWQPMEGADFYHVYYKEAAATDDTYLQIDEMLIRKYADYYRADVVGLKAGNYILKIVPTTDVEGTLMEDTSKQAVTASLEVKAHVREGFAFSTNSTYKTASGAYNNDGTLKTGAKVFYVTAKSINTISTQVIVNSKGGTETRTGIVDILAGKQKGHDTTPMAFRFIGEIKASDVSGLNSNNYIQVKGGKDLEMNYTLEGIGNDATINGWGILVRGVGNVEIRNIGVMNFTDDGISLDTDNINIWVHHCDFFYGQNKGGDQAKGDGSLDVKSNSKYVTLSFNHFWDSGKMSLCGMTSESGPNYITYHHNWFDHSDSRHPRVRTMTVHVYNNYFDGIAKYGVGATMGSSVFVENNYFRNATRPMLSSLQGTDIINGNGTFSGENGGMIKSFGNKMVNTNRTLVYHTQNKLNAKSQWDAIETATRDEKVPDTYITVVGGTSYNNFDTDANIIYAYNVETPDNAKEAITTYAGRTNGGDLRYSFTETDDASYDINTALSKLVAGYKGTVVQIGREESNTTPDPDPTDPEEPTDPEIPAGGMTHNFTANGLESSFFSITGNLSTDKGTVTYGGMTLTQCLKMESATVISFTITEESTLTLVFMTDEGGKRVKINDVNKTTDSYIYTIDLPADTYTIKKGDTMNLFYMSVASKNATSIKDIAKEKTAIYPSVVSDYLYIKSDAEVKNVAVYNLSGVMLFKANKHIDSIDMSTFASGNYIVKIITSEGSTQKKVIKK